MFSPCHIHVYVSIGTLESDLLSQSTPMCNQMDISLFIKALVRFISLFHKSNKIYKFISSVKTSQSIQQLYHSVRTLFSINTVTLNSINQLLTV